MATTNSRTIAIYVNSGLIVLTSTLLFFVFDIYKNANNYSSFIENKMFNIGVLICLLSLPILAFYCYLFSKIETDPKTNDNLKAQLGKVFFQNIFFWLACVAGICLVFTPFNLQIGERTISFRTIAIIGVVIGLLLFWINNSKLISARDK